MDDNEKLISEVKSFVKDFRLGIDEDTGPVISLEDISQFQGGGLRGKTTEEIEDFIFAVHSFNTRLKNKRASLKAFSLGLESKIGKYVSKNIEIVDKYYSEVQEMGGNRWDSSSLIALLKKKK